eukprot:1176016-Prorocentrum_minimum.AAC.4
MHSTPQTNNITSCYGSSCANNGKDALNTPETLKGDSTARYLTSRSSHPRGASRWPRGSPPSRGRGRARAGSGAASPAPARASAYPAPPPGRPARSPAAPAPPPENGVPKRSTQSVPVVEVVIVVVIRALSRRSSSSSGGSSSSRRKALSTLSECEHVNVAV